MIEPVAAVGRMGTETAFEVLARANQLAAEGRSIINLGIGQPDFETPAQIVDAGRQALTDGRHGLHPRRRHSRAARSGRQRSRAPPR